MADLYLNELARVPGLVLPEFNLALSSNYAYMPVRVTREVAVTREALVEQLRREGVMPRRYFHPLIPEFQYYRSNLSADPTRYPVATRASAEVLCLPIYPELTDGQVKRISGLIRKILTY